MGRAPDPTALLKELVSVPSISGEEAELARWICDHAPGWGLAATMVGPNVVIRIGDAGAPLLLLNSHLDTVPPVSGWRQDPFVPLEQGDRISGLGANDAKGCVAAMLCAAAQLAGWSGPGQVVLALTVEEETGCSGRGLQGLLTQLEEPEAAVIGEPTGLDICIAQKGLLILEVRTGGVARHAAHAHRLPGANAITDAARAICALDGVDLRRSDPLLGPVTCHVTTIAGGTRRNVIPDRCAFFLDVRTVDAAANEEIVAEVRAITGAEVCVFSDRLAPVHTDPGSRIARAAQRARPAARLVGSATMSDAVWTRRWPTIKIGPGITERSHTAGEHITRGELTEGVAFYRRLIEEYVALRADEA